MLSSVCAYIEIESIKTTSMETVSPGVLEKVKNVIHEVLVQEYLRK